MFSGGRFRVCRDGVLSTTVRILVVMCLCLSMPILRYCNKSIEHLCIIFLQSAFQIFVPARQDYLTSLTLFLIILLPVFSYYRCLLEQYLPRFVLYICRQLTFTAPRHPPLHTISACIHAAAGVPVICRIYFYRSFGYSVYAIVYAIHDWLALCQERKGFDNFTWV